MVHANGPQFRASGRQRCVKRICKKRLRLRIERIDRDGAAAKSLIDDRSFEVVTHEVWPKVDAEDRTERPCHNHD